MRVSTSRTLDRLVELRIIERILPVTEQGTRSRRRVYRIADNYLGFYLGPLMRFRAEIERGLGKVLVGECETLTVTSRDIFGTLRRRAGRSLRFPPS